MPNGSGALICGSNWRRMRVYQSLSTQQAGILLIIRMHKQGGWDGRRSRSVSFSPVCLCASYNDIICQKIQSAAGLHWVWLTKDMKQKIEIWGRVLLKLYIQLWKGKLRWYFGLLLTRKLFLLFFFLRRKNSSSTCPFHQADPDSSVLGWGEQALLAPLDCRCRKRRRRGSREVDEQRGIYDSVEISELEQASWGKGRADYKKPNSATLWELFKYLPSWQLFNCAIVTMYF